MRGVFATKFYGVGLADGRFGLAILVAALLMSATSVQAMGLGGNKADAKPAAEAELAAGAKDASDDAQDDAAADAEADSEPNGEARSTADAAPSVPKPATVGVPKSMMAPSAQPGAVSPPAPAQAGIPAKPTAPTIAAPAAPPAPAMAAKPAMSPVQAPMAAGQLPSAAQPVALEKPAEQPSDFGGRKADYYDNRAKEKLAEESRADGPGRQHPLQLALPSHSVIVCEAGCGKQGVHVVSKTLKATVRPVVAPLSDAMPTTGVVGRDRTLDCRGGCDRSAVRMGLGMPASAAAPAPQVLNEGAGRWLTSVTPEVPAVEAPARVAPTSKIEAPVAPMAKAPVATQSPVAAPAKEAAPTAAQTKTSKASREDWMARINRERAADKAADRAADILEPTKAE